MSVLLDLLSSVSLMLSGIKDIYFNTYELTELTVQYFSIKATSLFYSSFLKSEVSPLSASYKYLSIKDKLIISFSSLVFRK